MRATPRASGADRRRLSLLHRATSAPCSDRRAGSPPRPGSAAPRSPARRARNRARTDRASRGPPADRCVAAGRPAACAISDASVGFGGGDASAGATRADNGGGSTNAIPARGPLDGRTRTSFDRTGGSRSPARRGGHVDHRWRERCRCSGRNWQLRRLDRCQHVHLSRPACRHARRRTPDLSRGGLRRHRAWPGVGKLCATASAHRRRSSLQP